MLTHFPWDDGAITGTWLSTGQKSVKTRCERRVSFKTLALSAHVSCPDCRANLECRAVELESIVRDYPQHDTLGAFSNLAKFLRQVLAR